jgi:SAM-dependent methyltransferase
MNMPFSQACENNRRPILALLQPLLAKSTSVLEIGSGTGQHAVWFAKHLPHVSWQTSDLKENHIGINQWLNAYPAQNLSPPIELDLTRPDWPKGQYDCVYSANTAHIMPWEAVVNLFAELRQHLPFSGLFCLYGPMAYQGVIEPESNVQFDQQLRQRAAHQGIRDFYDLNRLAGDAGLILLDDHAMPANNRLLVWQKTEQ